MKRLLKRLIPAVLGMTMLFSMTAFAQVNEDAKNAYAQMEAKSAAQTDGNIYCHFNMQMKADGETASAAMDMNMLFKNMTDPKHLEMMCQYLISADGQQMPMMMWYKDGYSYTDMGGQKLKTEMDMTQALEMAANPAFIADSTALFSDLSLRVAGDKYILSYQMDNTKLNNYISQIFSQMGLDTSAASALSMNIHDIKGEYTLNSDFTYTDATISMALDLGAGSETLSMTLDGQMTQLNPGQPVEIFYPNLSEFQDLSSTQNAA